MKRLLVAMSALVLGLVAVPASALAATAYVDNGGPLTTGCTTPAQPCATITQGLAVAGAGGTVILDDGSSYTEQVTLAGGQTVRVENFDGTFGGSVAFVDGAAGTAFTITGPAATLQQLQISGDIYGVDVQAANVTIEHSRFTETGASAIGVRSSAAGGNLALMYNDFIDSATPADNTTGIQLGASALLTINYLEGLNRGIVATDAGTVEIDTVSMNEIREGAAGAPGVAMEVTGGTAVTGDGLYLDGAPSGDTTGLVLEQTGANATSAAIDRFRAMGFQVGARVEDTAGPVAFDNSLVADNRQFGLLMHDATGGRGNVTATNGTIVENGDPGDSATRDIRNEEAVLTLDSSITGTGIDATSGSSCSITYSRGPSTGAGCSNFSTTADPRLDNFGFYNLMFGSPMINAGNPGAPAPGASDYEFNPRAIDGTPCDGNDVARRDIGADEFIPPPVQCPPPPTPDVTSPETTIGMGPKKKSKSKSKQAKARFEFSSSELGSRFECSLDGAAFTSCASPHEVRVKVKHKAKQHTVRVVAIDAAGNRDSTPAEYTWKVSLKRKRR